MSSGRPCGLPAGNLQYAVKSPVLRTRRPNCGQTGLNMKPDLDYLSVDAFIADLTGASALRAALSLGVIDRLAAGEVFAGADAGLAMLLQLLRAGGVARERAGHWRLTDQFNQTLRYRDLLEAKLEFAAMVSGDAVERFADLIARPAQFMRESRLLELFDYGRCLHVTEENLRHARRWVRLTTALTRYEAGVMLGMHDLSQARRMLDIGGNSGELALQSCRANPLLLATVVDLPVVCEIGREHVRGHAECGRIEFTAGDALTGPLPREMDLVTFKSMLHDWPEEGVRRLLERANECLRPGGQVLIFERGPIAVGERLPPYSLLPILLFFRSFRGPELYQRMLAEMDFEQIQTRQVNLETPFFLLTARKRH